MSSKPPIPPRSRTTPARSQNTPKASPSGPTLQSHRELVRKPKSLIYAVGVAAIVITGSIFGAQLKTSKQATDERRLVESSNTNDASIVSARELESPTKYKTTTQDEAVNDADVFQHIKLLEDRKAILNRQKHGFESKLAALHERRRKRDGQQQQATR